MEVINNNDYDYQYGEDTQKEDCTKNEFLNPFWEPPVIIIEPCYHCWITNSLKNPVYLTFIVVIVLLSVGMTKMLIGHMCCRTKDGREIDVVGILLGTANFEHTRKYYERPNHCSIYSALK